MAQIHEFTSTTESYFILDGVKYPKVYEARIDSSFTTTRLKVIGANRDDDMLLYSTHYSNVRVDGLSFNSLNEALSAINSVVFSKGGGSGDGGTIQYQGVATQSNAPTVYSAETHPDGLTEIHRGFETLTSPNSWGNAVVTQSELNANDIYFVVTNGVVAKKLSPKIAGKSAYEVAVANGFVGTEAQWLDSLKSSITNLSVTPQKTTMFINQNIFDKATMVTSGKYVQGGNGAEVVAAEWSFISVPIDITLGNSIAVNKGSSNINTTDDELHFFNNVGTRIGGSTALIATIPAGTVLMKMNISNTLAALTSAKDTFIVAYSTTTPTTYYPYKYILNPIYISDLVELKSNIVGKKVRFVGDSITAASGQVGLVGYVSRIATNTGIIATNKGDNGATIGNIYPTASCFSGALLQYQFDAATNLVTFFGGTNDFANNIAIGTNSDGVNAIDTTVKGSLYIAIKWVRDNHQNCKILVMTPIERATNNNNSLGLKLIDYRNAIVDICVLMNVPYLDLYNNNLISMATAYKYLYDGLHPNNAGYEVLTPVIQEAIIEILS